MRHGSQEHHHRGTCDRVASIGRVKSHLSVSRIREFQSDFHNAAISLRTASEHADEGIMHRSLRWALVLLLWARMPLSSQEISEPEGYRAEDYHAPTPATLKGARVVTTSEAEQLWKTGGAIFVDVLPHAPRPANLPPEIGRAHV